MLYFDSDMKETRYRNDILKKRNDHWGRYAILIIEQHYEENSCPIKSDAYKIQMLTF